MFRAEVDFWPCNSLLILSRCLWLQCMACCCACDRSWKKVLWWNRFVDEHSCIWQLHSILCDLYISDVLECSKLGIQWHHGQTVQASFWYWHPSCCLQRRHIPDGCQHLLHCPNPAETWNSIRNVERNTVDLTAAPGWIAELSKLFARRWWRNQAFLWIIDLELTMLILFMNAFRLSTALSSWRTVMSLLDATMMIGLMTGDCPFNSLVQSTDDWSFIHSIFRMDMELLIQGQEECNLTRRLTLQHLGLRSDGEQECVTGTHGFSTHCWLVHVSLQHCLCSSHLAPSVRQQCPWSQDWWP